MFIVVLGQHVSIFIESSAGHSKKIDPYLKCLQMLKKTHHCIFMYWTGLIWLRIGTGGGHLKTR